MATEENPAEIPAPQPQKRKDIIDLESLIAGRMKDGGGSSADTILLIRILDMEEDRRRERMKEEKAEKASEAHSLTKEDLIATLKEVLEKNGKHEADGEPPKAIQELQAQIRDLKEDINKRNLTDKEKERDDRLIEKIMNVVNPAISKVADLEKSLAKISEGGGNVKTEIGTLKQIRETLLDIQGVAEAMGLHKDGDSKTVTKDVANLGGIPVDGTIPAWLAAIPIAVTQILDSMQKRLTEMGLIGKIPPPEGSEEGHLLNMPPPPAPEIPPTSADQPQARILNIKPSTGGAAVASPSSPMLIIPPRPVIEEKTPEPITPEPPQPEAEVVEFQLEHAPQPPQAEEEKKEAAKPEEAEPTALMGASDDKSEETKEQTEAQPQAEAQPVAAEEVKKHPEKPETPKPKKHPRPRKKKTQEKTQ